MSTVDLIVAAREQGPDIAQQSWSPQHQPTMPIDPIDVVSFTKLLVLVARDDYDVIMESYSKLTPEQPGIEPWDLENLLAYVVEVPGKYVTALANINDGQLASIAEQWSAIEELEDYNFKVTDLADLLSSFRALASQCVESRQALLMRSAP